MNKYLPIISFILCLFLTPLVRHVAKKKGWIAYPSDERWHKRPTALLGGIAIYCSTGLTLLYVTDFSILLRQASLPSGQQAPLPIGPVLWLGMTLCFCLGLLDDYIRIKPHTKLIGQVLIASIAAFLGFRLHWFSSLTLDTTLTIVWIVGITNAFNLIDNMDGLCAGIGLIAACFLSYLFFTIDPLISISAMILAGALAAFLFYNFSPATIFMGDSGSLMIGYALAMMSLYHSETISTNPITPYAVPVLLLMVPILDTTLVTLIRLLSGRKASVGGKDHTSHRLVLMGLTEKAAVRFLYLIGIVSGFAAVFVSKNDTLTSPVVIIPVALAIILMGVYLSQLRIYPEKEFSVLRDRPYTPILLELTYKKQLLMVILDFGLVAFSYYLSYRLRYDQAVFPAYFVVFLRSMPAIIACKLLIFFIIGVYRGIWGYMSANDVYVHLKASTLASLVSVGIVTFFYRFDGFSKGVFVIDWLVTTGLLLGTRGSFRIFLDTMKRKTLTGKTVLIYGAGRGGEFLLREIMNNHRLQLKPTGFLDDDVLKVGKKLQGYPILGRFEDLPRLVAEYKPDGMVVSFNGHGKDKIKRITDACRTNNLFLKQFAIKLADIDETP
ncbi:MAG: glycosyl transferase [Desulfobacterales bacterium]|jgi:UDP-GlcNAc:undecaprenyl-phosphate GlcNAc-1-phosphate transferase|nr:glycosyl transferase [Desulfobacterales bacterium]